MQSLIPYLILAGVIFAIFTAMLAFLVPWMLLSIKRSNLKILAVLIDSKQDNNERYEKLTKRER